jgi:hypothetical protein
MIKRAGRPHAKAHVQRDIPVEAAHCRHVSSAVLVYTKTKSRAKCGFARTANWVIMEQAQNQYAIRAPKENTKAKAWYAKMVLISAKPAKRVNTAPIQDHQIVQIFLPVHFSAVREQQMLLQVIHVTQESIPTLVQQVVLDAHQVVLETKPVELVLKQLVCLATRVNSNRVMLANKLVKHVLMVKQVHQANQPWHHAYHA